VRLWYNKRILHAEAKLRAEGVLNYQPMGVTIGHVYKYPLVNLWYHNYIRPSPRGESLDDLNLGMNGVLMDMKSPGRI
jgi:hypothetical protein